MTDILPNPPEMDLLFQEMRPLDQNPAAVYLATLGIGGRRTMRQALDVIAEMITGSPECLFINWAALRYQHTAAVRAVLASRYQPATANKMLSALRGVLRQAWKLGQMSAEDYQRARDVENVTGTTLPAGRELVSGELYALLTACGQDETAAGVRDAAMIAVLYAGGLRREEIAHLILQNYEPVSGKLTLRGKRNRERTVYLTGGAAEALNDWLLRRGYGEGPLFYRVNKGGRIVFQPLSSQAVYNMLKKRAGEANVEDFSPHDLRRTFVSDLLDAGADIAIVAKMAGHASVNTTARYDRRPEDAKKKAAGLLHVPYKKK